MNELEARRLAEEWISQSHFAVPMTTRRSIETAQSWLFEVVSISGGPLFGNAPLVVGKQKGAVIACRDA